jgi:hypothetical protein
MTPFDLNLLQVNVKIKRSTHKLIPAVFALLLLGACGSASPKQADPVIVPIRPVTLSTTTTAPPPLITTTVLPPTTVPPPPPSTAPPAPKAQPRYTPPKAAPTTTPYTAPASDPQIATNAAAIYEAGRQIRIRDCKSAVATRYGDAGFAGSGGEIMELQQCENIP